jgi:ATP-dependent Clp protease ATP-binding subunit ClpX
VQQALLKILEGTITRVPPAGGRKHPEQKYIELDTTNILFICGGAFVGLQDIVTKRHSKKNFGFSAEKEKTVDLANGNTILRPDPEDLIKYGMIPEFVGRLPVVAMLNELTEDDLVHILTQPKNCIVKQYKKLFALDGVELELTDEAVRAIAKEALTRKTGARGLRAIMEDLMIDVMYNIGEFAIQKKLVITEEMVIAQLKNPGILVDLLKK